MKLALLLVVIFLAVGAATVRYLDRALRRQPIPPVSRWNREGEPVLWVDSRARLRAMTPSVDRLFRYANGTAPMTPVRSGSGE